MVMFQTSAILQYSTVDGRNPAPVDMVNIPLITGFHTCQVVSRISEPSTVSSRSIHSSHGLLRRLKSPPQLDSLNFPAWFRDVEIFGLL